MVREKYHQTIILVKHFSANVEKIDFEKLLAGYVH